MDGEGQALTRDDAAQLLQWWLESGVDIAIGEQPRQWLKAAPAPAAASPAAPAVSAPAAIIPDDWDAFRRWLAESPGLPLDRPGARRVLPMGVADAEAMILCEAPGTDDGDQPIGGEAWILLTRMLAAIGIAPDAAYIASLACFQSPGARLQPTDLDRCAEIARRHVALAKPKRLILFGEAPARALLGKPLRDARGHIHKVEGVRAIVTYHPRWLMQRPGDKALAWRDLLLLMEEEI